MQWPHHQVWMLRARAGAVAALMLACALFACGAEQPRPACTVGRAGSYAFAASYTLTSSPSAGACAQLKGERIGLQKYNPAMQTKDGKRQDPSKALLAIRTERLAGITGTGTQVTSL